MRSVYNKFYATVGIRDGENELVITRKNEFNMDGHGQGRAGEERGREKN